MPDVSSSGIALLNSITADKIWNETSLQYFFGDDTALSLDSQFAAFFHQNMSGNPDATFAFSAVATRAFTMIDTVSQLDFSQTFDSSVADQVLVSANRPSSSLEGFFQFPGKMYHDANPTTDSWSLGTFNSGLDYMLKAPELGGGEYANWTVLHEIGHSLGLLHTHKETKGLPPLDTVGKYMDNERYSVMSYNPASNGTAYGHAVSFMALDIAALQALYGAESYAASDSSYSLFDAKSFNLALTEGSVSIGRAYYCIWDSAGHDSITYQSLDKSVLINLNDATLDTSGIAAADKDVIASLKRTDFYSHLSNQLQQEIVDPWHHAGGFFSRVLTQSGSIFLPTDGGFTIAHGVMIEDAMGGAAADLLIGNKGANALYGNSGNDTLLGSGGADYLNADTQNDVLDGGKGNDILDGGEGSDRFIFSDGYGHDEITKFTHQDVIDLKLLSGFKNMSDLYNHMRYDNATGDTEIKIGQDILQVDHLRPSFFHNSDFII
jgi:hypothetical protein